MFTVIFEIYRRADRTQEQMREHWLGVHKELGMKIPHVVGYRLCPVTEAAGVEGEEIAGFAIFDFDDRAGYEAALQSPEFAETAADAGEFARHFSQYNVEVVQAI
ncbi:EthD family reductase [Baekduia soli]|uniref:EthD family reductase n=1 Tax=Baekduia soli TaxID=496014 RepID=A0A5B8U324_9ACTN|nr:EthD family reductase [Baekduia soli]QEC47245.1 EthD family reductase [Baekduia soli]